MSAKPSKTTVTSQIGSAKIVYKSLMHRMTHFKFNLCRDIEKNPGPVARRQFMNYCLTQPGKYSCAIDSFLELAFAILKDSKRDQLQCVFSNCIRCMFTVRKL